MRPCLGSRPHRGHKVGGAHGLEVGHVAGAGEGGHPQPHGLQGAQHPSASTPTFLLGPKATGPVPHRVDRGNNANPDINLLFRRSELSLSHIWHDIKEHARLRGLKIIVEALGRGVTLTEPALDPAVAAAAFKMWGWTPENGNKKR